MSKQFIKHSDLEAELWPGLNPNPFKLFLQLGCAASVMVIVVSWLILIAVDISQWLDIKLGHYLTLPIAAWLVLLAFPVLIKSRRGTLKILDAIVRTCEAFLARAGYSIDLNNDSYIGHIQPVQVEPPQTTVVTPAIWSGPGGTKLLANQAAAIPDVANQPPEPVAPPAPPVRRLWNLPGEVKCPEETVISFVERIFIIGWGRGEWVGPGKPLEREVYDALLNLLVQAQIIEGRKAGYAGKLTVDDPHTAKIVLGLIPKTNAGDLA